MKDLYNPPPRSPSPLLPRLRTFARAYGRAAAYALGLYYCYLFYLAYRSPGKGVLFWINAYGEANIEAVIMVLTVPAILYALISEARQYQITIEKKEGP